MFKRFSQWLARKKEQNQTFKELSRMSNRELNDIGLGRGDIYEVAYGDRSR